jgi:hypothetical protein
MVTCGVPANFTEFCSAFRLAIARPAPELLPRLMPILTSIPKILAAALLGAAAGGAASAQEIPVPTMREISPGVYEIGALRLDQKARSVSFPGTLNLNEGPLEYLLVTEQGSTHESLLVTAVKPSDLHFAMLLLGAKGAGIMSAKDAPPGQIDAKYLKTAPKLKGENIAITARWKTGDADKSVPVEDWVLNAETKKPMSRGPWIYNGSMFNDGHFLAQIEGAHAALVTYPSALINNPRKGSDDDQLWTANTKAAPPPKTPIEITIQLLSEPDPKPAP